MSSVRIADALAGKIDANTTVNINGWVKTKRDSKAGFSFIHLHDGSCFHPIQVVADQKLHNYEDEIKALTTGCAISIVGTLVESQGKGQQFEIQAKSINVVGWVDDPDTYPMQPKRHSFEYLREVAHLRPRTNTISAIARVRHTLANAIHQYFNDNGFYWINTPILTASDCEGAGDLFRVSTLDLTNLPLTDNKQIDFSQDFFGTEAFLTVSGQLNVECFCLAMSKVYTFGPTFRAENSNTSRHLAEFWMIEPEIAFADLQDSIDLAGMFIQHLATTILEKCPDDMEFFQKHIDSNVINQLQNIINKKVERIDYADAIDILIKSNKKFEFPVKWGLDLQTEHERFLTENYAKGPVAVMNYPKEIKAFYMRLNDDEKTVAAMDVLAPGIGEIIGGAQREERFNMLDQRMTEAGLDKNHYGWYLDLRKYGTVPHAGFGLGFERLVSYFTGMHNVRDVIPFPRVPNNISF